jgi:hypothetical protein
MMAVNAARNTAGTSVLSASKLGSNARQSAKLARSAYSALDVNGNCSEISLIFPLFNLNYEGHVSDIKAA